MSNKLPIPTYLDKILPPSIISRIRPTIPCIEHKTPNVPFYVCRRRREENWIVSKQIPEEYPKTLIIKRKRAENRKKRKLSSEHHMCFLS